jgi:hypothetical protein
MCVPLRRGVGRCATPRVRLRTRGAVSLTTRMRLARALAMPPAELVNRTIVRLRERGGVYACNDRGGCARHIPRSDPL